MPDSCLVLKEGLTGGGRQLLQSSSLTTFSFRRFRVTSASPGVGAWQRWRSHDEHSPGENSSCRGGSEGWRALHSQQGNFRCLLSAGLTLLPADNQNPKLSHMASPTLSKVFSHIVYYVNGPQKSRRLPKILPSVVLPNSSVSSLLFPSIPNLWRKEGLIHTASGS